MSEQAARSWLSTHHELIPALEISHREALETLEDHSKTVADLADIIALDPGMSLSLFHDVNSKLQDGGKNRVDSVHAALSLLGDSAIADLVMQHKVLNETHPYAPGRQAYHQLMSRTYHLLAQLGHFVSSQGISAIHEIRTAALLHNVGEFCACLFDLDKYRQYQAKFLDMGSDANSAKPVFGFDFHELGRVYAEKSNLPALVTESLDQNILTGRKARLIQLAADVSHQAEVGWYHSSMKATEGVCSAYLNQSLNGFYKHLQTVAIESAHHCPFDDVLPAAARLIMMPDPATAKSDVPVPSKQQADGQDFENRIKALLETAQPTQAQILDLLLSHLHDDLHLTRVVLMLLSADKSKLGTRAGKGISKHSPIRNLTIDISNASLLKSLIGKPQALWIEPGDYHKYEASLPAKFKASFLHESFFLMSLHVSGKSVGMIFCDRAQAVTRLDKISYIKFKSAIMLISKALTHLAKRNQRTAAR
ncbi:MAG: HDOD domain-containing protein [Gammaproteobacteria bacterium]|nr:HDOD domain-containing protein [Gammaproteobacteria bacterium]